MDDDAAELEALQRDGVRPAPDLDEDAPRALVDAQARARMAPPQEVDLPRLLEGEFRVHGKIIGHGAEDLMSRP